MISVLSPKYALVCTYFLILYICLLFWLFIIYNIVNAIFLFDYFCFFFCGI